MASTGKHHRPVRLAPQLIAFETVAGFAGAGVPWARCRLPPLARAGGLVPTMVFSSSANAAPSQHVVIILAQLSSIEILCRPALSRKLRSVSQGTASDASVRRSTPPPSDCHLIAFSGCACRGQHPGNKLRPVHLFLQNRSIHERLVDGLTGG